MPAMGLISSCKQKNPDQAIVTIVIGQVRLARPGEQERPVVHKEILQKNDVVATGPGSVLVFQFGSESLIQVEPNTEVILSSFFIDQGEASLALGKGKLFSNIRRLQKGESFKVQTRTSTAAVRGTEFSVLYKEGESVVAVNRGSIAVQHIGDNNEIKEEKSVENGSAAVVKDRIVSRNLNRDEEKELAQFGRMSPVSDVEAASDSDLKKMEDDLIKSRGVDKAEDVKPAGPQKKEGVKKPGVKEKKIESETVAKKIRVDNGKTNNGAIWTSKRVFGTSDTIVVNYKNIPEYRNCWISISKAGSPDRSYESYHWTYSAKDGQMTFPNLNLAPGNYEVRVHFSKSNEVNMRYTFSVK
jgi:hypothetical protein